VLRPQRPHRTVVQKPESKIEIPGAFMVPERLCVVKNDFNESVVQTKSSHIELLPRF